MTYELTKLIDKPQLRSAMQQASHRRSEWRIGGLFGMVPELVEGQKGRSLGARRWTSENEPNGPAVTGAAQFCR